MADLNNTKPDAEEQADREELLQFVTDGQSKAESEMLRNKKGVSDFERDAAEGLQQFKQKEKLDAYAKAINAGLQDQLAARKQKVQKRTLKNQQWYVLTVLIILAICIIAYVMINMYKQNNG